VLRDRLFVRLWALNFLFVTAGYSLFNLVPPFARDHAHLSEKQIGAVFFTNTGLIVLAQLPISRAIEGHRRLRALALMPLLWIVSWLMVDGGGYWLTGTAAFLVIAIAMGILRDRRVLPRPCAPGARRRDRAGPSARPVLRRALALVGARGHRRPCGRRLPARVGAVRAVAGRGGRLPDRGDRLAPDGTDGPRALPAHPEDRARSAGTRRRGGGLGGKPG